MELMNFTYELSEEQKQEKKKKVAQLLKNPYVKQWRKEHDVSDTFIYHHSGRFQDYCSAVAKCEGCAGIAFCRQPMKGVHMDLLIDGVLQSQLVPCAYKLEEKTLYGHEKNYRVFNMLREYMLVDLTKLDLSQENEDYKSVVIKVLKTLMDDNNYKGLYLRGKPGVGKSYLAAGMTNYYAKHNKKVAFVNVPEFVSDLKMMFQDSAAFEAKLRVIRNVDVLVLDDIGGESVTNWSRDDILLPLLDARLEKRKLTIFTSNYSFDDLKEKLARTGNFQQEPIAAERLLDRIRALSCEIFVKGCSRRK